MKVKTQKRLASDVLKAGKKRVVFDSESLPDIKEAITKRDIRSLVRDRKIKARKEKGVSRYRARKNLIQKRKGRRKGKGSRKGRAGARLSRKEKWMLAVRMQRKFLKNLKGKGSMRDSDYRKIYNKIKGGFFRSKRHIKLYLEEHKLIQDVKKKKAKKN